ncbi:MAG TPA: hypothetical protein VKM93_09490 [Terriglobia bacterium]|nr:hypothetical protein [Terriglobia bacterium]
MGLRTRKYPAQIHSSAAVSQATSEVLSANGFVAPGTADAEERFRPGNAAV